METLIDVSFQRCINLIDAAPSHVSNLRVWISNGRIDNAKTGFSVR